MSVAAEIDALLRRAGFARPAFETIVASGPNSALPHARPGRPACCRPGDGVVLDFGGVYDGYCVDLTRTVQLRAGAAAFVRDCIEAVAEAQRPRSRRCGRGARPAPSTRRRAAVLAAHGLGEAFGARHRARLGLEVHEEPRITRRRSAGYRTRSLEPGMVFTIEPGAYVPGVGGVRIEDDVLVTETGASC